MRFISYSLSESKDLRFHAKFTATQISNVGLLKLVILKKVWSPIVWKLGERSIANFDFSDYCGLDFDDTLSVDDAIGIFKDYRAVIATTENHRLPKKGEVADRFRVIIPWERRISCQKEYTYNMAALIKEYGADPACKDGGRLFKPSREIVFANDSELLPVESYVPRTAQQTVYQGTPGWLLDMVARGSDGEPGRNYAGFKIAAAAMKCGATDGEAMQLLNRAYGVQTLEDREKKSIIKSARKSASAPCRVTEAPKLPT